MKMYYRVMLGRKSVHANECQNGGFIGADYDIHEDLTGKVPDQWREFNKQYIPVFLSSHPNKTKIAAGLACGALWTISRGIENGDTVLCPDGSGKYLVGEVADDYYYEAGQILPHRRKVVWLPVTIDRAEMSEGLRNSTGSTGTVCDMTRAGHAEEITGRFF